VRADVLALAGALGELTSAMRHARTMLWCSLQLGTCDLPTECIDAAKRRSTDLNFDLPLLRQHPPLASEARLAPPFECWEKKLLTSETGDICNNNDDDDDVFTTYSAELADIDCAGRAPNVSRQLM